jgi:hypothetical protein
VGHAKVTFFLGTPLSSKTDWWSKEHFFYPSKRQNDGFSLITGKPVELENRKKNSEVKVWLVIQFKKPFVNT